MSAVIYKYTLSLQDEQTVAMPPDAEVLSVQVQAGTICIFAKHNPNDWLPEHWKPRRFVLVSTGIPFSDSSLIYRGTVQIPPFVWHVFEDPIR